MGRIITLDLEKITLYGFQHSVPKWKVNYMLTSIEAGDTFPLVPVFQISELVYILDKNAKDPRGICSIDGGHTRAVAHYKAKEPLGCELGDLSPRKIKNLERKLKSWIKIQDMDLCSQSKLRVRALLQRDPNYRKHPINF